MGVAKVETCRSCGAAVVWLLTTKGHWMIIDAATVSSADRVFDPPRHIAHWADCPQREHWRQKPR
jgi:hypothetical protein